jgi:flavin reductase (DIM6/NTAB) family NADH-FMN oxidoreductase RutF
MMIKKHDPESTGVLAPGTIDVRDQAELRRVFGTFPTGVTAVAASAGGSPLGLTASSFTSVSLEPPIVSVSIAHSSTTWPRLREASRLGISVLGAHQEHVSRRLSARDGDRFASLSWDATAGGAVFLEGASAWLECSLHQEVSVGDHLVVMLRVHALDSDPDMPPLVFHGSRYRQLQPLPSAEQTLRRRC